MADERTDLIKRLAPLVLEDRSRAAAEKRSTDTPWYFININHPAMRPFYNSWLQSRGRLFLPGDIDRAEFELSLLSNKPRHAGAGCRPCRNQNGKLITRRAYHERNSGDRSAGKRPAVPGCT